MATHDYVIANQSGAAFRTDLNNALAAIVSNNSNSSSPATTYAYQWWADTNAGVLKIRNSANNAWVELLQLDGTLTLEDGSVSAPALAFRDDLNTGIFSSAADEFNIATGGVERVSLSSGATVFNQGGSDTDFRVESDTNTHMLFVDSGNNRVGIGTSSPSNVFDVSGTISGSNFLLTSTAGTYGVLNDTSIAFFGSASTGIMQFKTNGDNERMRIDSSGNVGIGTSTPPAGSLHVHLTENPVFNLMSTQHAQNNGCEINFGVGQSASADGNTGARIEMNIPDSGGTMTGELKIRTNSGDSLNERLRIEKSGSIRFYRFNTLFGNEGFTLDNETSGGPQLLISRVSANPVLLNRNTTDGQIIEFRRGWGAGGSIDVGTNSATYNTSSDYRLKENIVAISDGITRLKTLKPSRFNWIGDTSSTRDGFIAHEVTAVPEAITGTKDEVYTEDQPNINVKVGDPKYQGIDQSKLVPLLVAAVQELITKVETLEAA